MTDALTSRPLSRRRMLTILAGAGAALLPGAAWAGGPRRFEWQGTALGADARIILYHRDPAAAAAAVKAAIAEVERLEVEFSLYRADSQLCRLNRSGTIEAPSHDMRRLLALCRRFGDLSGGAFDVTVQPLWRLYADHFAAHPKSAAGPDADAVARARALVDYRRIQLTPARVSLAPGMAVTLNGIAQGYITDRVTDLLRRRGWSNVLVNLGETRALAGRADGNPWSVALAGALDGNGKPMAIPLVNRAAATSAGDGTRFEATGRHHHIFDPARGESSRYHGQVSVVADDATTADALSTALYVMAPGDALGLLRRFAGAEAWLTGPDGRIRRLTG
jgi:thiamine biosynthesis lipoprotein